MTFELWWCWSRIYIYIYMRWVNIVPERMMIILLRLGKFLNLESFKSHIPTFTKESCLKFNKFAIDWRLKLVNFHSALPQKTTCLLRMDDIPLSWMEFSYCTYICDSIWLKTLWQCKLEMTFCFDIQIIQIHNPPHACYISQPNLVTFPLFGTLHHQNSTIHEIKHFKEMPYSTWF